MKKITINILDKQGLSVDFANLLYDKYSWFTVKQIGSTNSLFPRDHSIKINKNLLEVATDTSVDVIIDFLDGDEESFEFIKAGILSHKYLLSHNVPLLEHKNFYNLIQLTANKPNKIYFNSLIKNQHSLRDDITNQNILLYKNEIIGNYNDISSYSWQGHCFQVLIESLFSILHESNRSFIEVDFNKLEQTYHESWNFIDDDKNFIIINNFFPDNYISELNNFINSLTIDNLKSFKEKKEQQLFEAYCLEFLKRDDFNQVLTEGALSMHDFLCADFIPLEEKYNNYFISKLKHLFTINGVDDQYVQFKTDSNIQFLPKLDQELYMDLHHDIVDGQLTSFGIVYYLNDDYEGGEIFFPHLQKMIKPVANSLLIFKNNKKNFLHGVKPVTKGMRYSIPNFVWLVK